MESWFAVPLFEWESMTCGWSDFSCFFIASAMAVRAHSLIDIMTVSRNEDKGRLYEMKIRAAEDEGVKLLFVASCNVMCDETVGKRICLNDPPTLQVRSLTTVMFGTDYYFLVHVTCAQRFWRAHSSTHHVIAIIIFLILKSSHSLFQIRNNGTPPKHTCNNRWQFIAIYL